MLVKSIELGFVQEVEIKARAGISERQEWTKVVLSNFWRRRESD